jgi:hypothetical protein
MHKMKTALCSLILLSLLSGCASTTKVENTNIDKVFLYFDDSSITDCTPVGTVTGSEGHWYTFFFITNKELLISAVNDMKNEATQLGGNSIVIHSPSAFNTSVTLLGSAYLCPSL